MMYAAYVRAFFFGGGGVKLSLLDELSPQWMIGSSPLGPREGAPSPKMVIILKWGGLISTVEG